MNQSLVYLFVFCAILTFILGFYIATREWVASRGQIRSRLTISSGERIASEAELFDIRQSRSLTQEGNYTSPIVALNKLILQSGTRLGLSGVILAALCCAVVAYIVTSLTGFGLLMRMLAATAFGLVMPLVVLRAMREGRQRRFEEQLPDAIDTIIRSLRAGHTISTAISTVSKHLPDPIGSEFRLTASEMTYGLDLESAIINLHARVGQADLGILSLAITMQSKTGGNLAELLSGISRVIRDRFKLRRKARALSSEARMSAYIMSALPVLLFCILWLVSPSYYGDVWGNSLTRSVLSGAVFWMLLGDYIMYRMARISV